MGNVQSAGNKINTVADYKHKHDLDMYLIVESWLPKDEHRKKGDIKNNRYEIKHMLDKGEGSCVFTIKPLFPIKTMVFIEVMLTVWSKKVCLVTI